PFEGITPLPRGHGETIHCHHLYIFRYDPAQFNHLSKNDFVDLLAAEGVPCFRGYPHPLYRQPLFQNRNFMGYAIPDHVSYTDVVCPVAEQACREAVWILQHAMLGTADDMADFARAVQKVQHYALSKQEVTG
ncbi:MAG: DegT/DnrJ/EryC1/StrS family aminotransferase, partial [Bacteroidetes bacterium]|nr:DegT/DnrJ/EryC1/StrS family aminotransferase [Bacteroidota bacterium]